MAEVGEVFYREFAGPADVHGDVAVGSGDGAVDEDVREGRLAQVRHEWVAGDGGAHEQPVDAAAVDERVAGRLFLEVFGEQGEVAVFAGSPVGAAGDGDVGRVVGRGSDQGEGHGAGVGQCAGAGVGLVAEVVGDAEDAPPGLGAHGDGRVAVEDP
ncbi:hypothetical protein Psuf_005860 [Phytohabitans suffuscus]|uniref:Uncharacterized protein n=1 Tax=Phytohabitans suffuscus TaxID=624315 RepID=A0A6F8YB70_9ACTN|nr:hypothetical protein [Phytohabitans suffuscus]BCB83273.1 hypothetical protein Psuf_005860 [Phytohabitans suffuscus]